jgi:hypothetical protein
MIRHSFDSSEKTTAADKSVSERVRLQDTSPKQAAQAGVERVSIALNRVFAEVRSANRQR